MGRLFGTDGVRGLANRELTAELTLDLSVAAAHVLAEAGELRHDGRRPLAIVGRDPRASGEFLEAAVVAGLASAGIDVIRVGVLPTPAISWLTDVHEADLGVMLSASHNPMPDNGIKFFSRGGHKLADELEDRIESQMREPWDRPIGAAVGRIRDLPDATTEYVNHLVGTMPGRLDGLRIVVDCANGAASEVGPAAYRQAGADVIVIDATGALIDGDQILAILALAARDADRLPGATVVTTVMANLGFRQAMERHNITVVETAVGDRYVLEAMKSDGFTLGGEQSGHIVMLDHAKTGDGVLTALHLLARLADSEGATLTELAATMTRLPQVLINVPHVDRSRSDSDPEVQSAVAAARAELGASGRVLLRPSGTEPLVRVMVEAVDGDQAQRVADQLAATVASALALSNA